MRRVSPSIARRRLGTISGDVCAVHLAIGGLAANAWAWTTMDETGRICADGWRPRGRGARDARRTRRERDLRDVIDARESTGVGSRAHPKVVIAG